MNCQEARELSSEYLDQRLAPAQVSLLEEHVEVCPDCEDEIEALRGTISWIGSLDAIEPSPHFLDQVQRKIDKRGKRWRVWGWLFEPTRIKVPLELTALIILSITALQLHYKSPELSKETGVVNRLESFEVARDKLPEAPEERHRTEKANQMSEGKPTAAIKPEARPSIPKSSEQSREASQQLGEASDLSEKANAPSSLEGSRIAEDKAEEKSLEARGRTNESDRTAKTEAVTQPGKPSREAQEEMAAGKLEVHEISTDDVDVLAAKIKALLAKVEGKLLTQEGASGSGLLLTVELPQHRQTEFLAALREESNLKSKPSASRHGAFGGGTLDKPATDLHRSDAGEKAQKRKVAPAAESSPQTDEPMATLRLRILPKE